MSDRSLAAVLRDIAQVNSIVRDEAVKARLLAQLDAELAEIAGVGRQLPLPDVAPVPTGVVPRAERAK